MARCLGTILAALLVGCTACAKSTSIPTEKILTDGPTAPQVKAATIDGSSVVNTKELAGRIVVLNFWASWCGPCRSEMPDLEKLSKSRPMDLTIIGINIRDSKSNALGYMQQIGITYPVIPDSDGKIALLFPYAMATPSTIFIDGEGKVRFVHLGAFSGTQVKHVLEQIAVKKN